MNVRLLKRIITAIKKQPRRLNMATWLDRQDHIAPCGTAGCIAGHAVLLKKQKRGMSWAKAADKAGLFDIEDEARYLLGLNDWQARRLFYSSRWPKQFSITGEPETTAERDSEARIAVKRIEHFINTEGKE